MNYYTSAVRCICYSFSSFASKHSNYYDPAVKRFELHSFIDVSISEIRWQIAAWVLKFGRKRLASLDQIRRTVPSRSPFSQYAFWFDLASSYRFFSSSSSSSFGWSRERYKYKACLTKKNGIISSLIQRRSCEGNAKLDYHYPHDSEALWMELGIADKVPKALWAW